MICRQRLPLFELQQQLLYLKTQIDLLSLVHSYSRPWARAQHTRTLFSIHAEVWSQLTTRENSSSTSRPRGLRPIARRFSPWRSVYSAGPRQALAGGDTIWPSF